MPTRPTQVNLTNSSVDILNAIRNSASANYRDYVPAATPDQASIREIGAIIMDYPLLQNEFLSALVNRIGRVLITSKMYSNPWAVFKQGVLEFGETIEEIFVNIAKPFQYDPSTAENKVFAREIPDVRAAFHIMNYQKFYKATIQNEQLRQAFLSWQGITDLITKIVESMYTGANYDEFQTMKYLLARHILNGELYPVDISFEDTQLPKVTATAIKTMSNNFEFMSPKYNNAGVQTYTLKEDQYLIVNSNFDALMDVNVLATAFNMEKAQFMGHRVLIDGFGVLDNKRLAMLFANDPNYTAITAEEMEALNTIPAVLVSDKWFMIFDNLYNFTEQYNGEGLYWNYWYHVWKTFSVSPFANAAVFTFGDPAISSVAITPAAAAVYPGQRVLLTADVTTTNFASKAVDWAIDGEVDGVTVDIYGAVSVADTVDPGTVITVSATSVFDNTKSATATITVGGAVDENEGEGE